MNEAGYAYVNNNLVGLSGTVVRCARERNDSSHITVVYAILDECETYGPLIMVKGTPSNFCCYGVELQHHDICSDWNVLMGDSSPRTLGDTSTK